MNQKTLNEFRDYLVSRNYSSSSVTGYIRKISDLPEPLDGKDPAVLLDFVDESIKIKKTQLSSYTFNTARASLNAFFLMKTGIQIKTFRRADNR